ncbi:hypothetical protein VMCG_00190 [Cytospora schulzeri]|uniref:Uncharacterized protein n=1 Tax=Cytospora schulzeri TaxID=448051 RepID=A0A423X921_9PEZI|nr:hypothetical protein VMCG_00190 [Valsa malicola]
MAAPETWRAPPEVVRSQIVENCSFFSPPGAQLSVILTREPLGTYKAIILRADLGGQREAVLSSESADTVNRAFELLLVRSADAVQNYITTNGFEFAPSSKKMEEIVNDEDDDEDDDGVSSVSSSEIIDDDPPLKDLGDSTLSLSEVESAYESVSEDGTTDARYSRARATHTSRNSTTTHHHAYPMRVRRSRSPRRPDDPDFPREGRQQQRRASPHYSTPHHNFPIHRRRPISPIRGSGLNNTTTNNAGGGVDGPMGRHHMPPPPLPLVGGAPSAPPLRPIHPAAAAGGMGGNGNGLGPWRQAPGGSIPPPVLHANAMNIRADPAGPLRPHPSQYFSLHPPPGMMMALGHVPTPPGGGGAMPQQQQQHAQGKPPIGINRDATNGPSPMSTGGIPSMPAGPIIQAGSGGSAAAAAAAAAVPPPPPSSSSLSSISSTPTLTASPNKPPSPPSTPAAIDYRLCIRSRNPNSPGPQDGTQADQQQQQWHEERAMLHTPPTRAHVRAAALHYIESHPGLFKHLRSNANGHIINIINNNNNNNNNSNNGHNPSCRPLDGFVGPGAWAGIVCGGADGGGRRHQHQHQHQHQQQTQTHLRVTLTRAVFGDKESYDLSTYAEDDLSRLCAGMCAAGQVGMPLFEVTVSNVGPAGSFFTLD